MDKKKEDMYLLAEYRNYLRKNPKLIYLFLELTNKCNMKCMHCGSYCSENKPVFLKIDSIMKVLQSIKRNISPSTVMICLTGGEPLLHPEFEKIISRIDQMGFPWGITTNGVLIDRKMATVLKRYHIGSITLSLDGTRKTHEWLRKINGIYKRTLNAITYLTENYIPVQITTVVHRKNIGELEEIYNILSKMQVSSWRLTNIEPIGRALDNMDIALSEEEIIYLLEYIREKRFSKEVTMDVTYGCSHYLTKKYEKEVRDYYFICGSGIYVASVLCNGDIYSCLDIQRRPELVQGNVEKDDFYEIWKSGFGKFRVDRTKYSNICLKCEDRMICGGDSNHTWDYVENNPMICLKKTIDEREKY